MPDTTKLKLKALKAGCVCGPNVSLVCGLCSGNENENQRNGDWTISDGLHSGQRVSLFQLFSLQVSTCSTTNPAN